MWLGGGRYASAGWHGVGGGEKVSVCGVDVDDKYV